MSRLLRHPVMVVWSAYILLVPFYLVRGGLPQPGDALIVLLVPMAVAGWNGRLSRASIRTLRPLLVFTIWVCIVSLAWALFLWAWGVNLLYPLYYVYNTAFFFAALVLYHRFGDLFLRLTVLLIYVTVLFQVFASFFIGGGRLRGELFFDNPNQLGYFALLAACVIALGQRRLRFGVVWAAIGLTSCAYLALLSSSRSAVAAIAFLGLLLVFSNLRLLLLAGLASVALTVVESPIDSTVTSFQRRLEMKRHSGSDFLSERAYDRIWTHKEYVLFGAAEGHLWRFAKPGRTRAPEIHSSAGTLIFSYGVVGVVLFSLFLWKLIRGSGVRFALVLVPPLTYSVAHQGLRFTMLWVLLALFCALKEAPAEWKRSYSSPASAP